MHTACLEIVRASVSVVTTRCCWGGGRSVNEKVWIGVQWSPPDVTIQGSEIGPQVWWLGEGEGVSSQIWCPEVGPKVWCLGRGGGYTTMWAIPWCIWYYLHTPLEQTDTCENITFPQRYLTIKYPRNISIPCRYKKLGYQNILIIDLELKF